MLCWAENTATQFPCMVACLSCATSTRVVVPLCADPTLTWCVWLHQLLSCRYFTHQELHELFKWDPDALNASETQQLLKQQHAQQLRQLQQQQSQELTSHVCWVEDNPLCAGTSQHGLLFSLEDPEGKQLNISAAGLAAGQYGGSSSGSSARRFQDSGGQPRKGNGSSSSSSSQGRFRGSEDGADGGSGSSSMQPSAAALDEMMQSLHIGNGSSSRSGLPAGASARSAGPDLQQQKVQELLKHIKQLQSQLHSAKCDLQQLGPRLPDGGAKVGGCRFVGVEGNEQKLQCRISTWIGLQSWPCLFSFKQASETANGSHDVKGHVWLSASQHLQYLSLTTE